MSIVAHEDDDLLFCSPDLLHDVRAGRSVETIYVTAGDANRGASYWQGREAGVKAAYAEIAGARNTWTTSDAGLRGHPVPIFTLAAHPAVRLAFLRVPDGFPTGGGGSRHGHESLQKLWLSQIPVIHPVDGTPEYGRQDLVESLAALLLASGADRVNCLDYVGTFGDGDHSDHHASAYFARAAHRLYTTSHEFVGHQGYGISQRPENVSRADYTAKKNAYLTYAPFDPASCQTESSCLASSTGTWWGRQYRVGSEHGGATQP